MAFHIENLNAGRQLFRQQDLRDAAGLGAVGQGGLDVAGVLHNVSVFKLGHGRILPQTTPSGSLCDAEALCPKEKPWPRSSKDPATAAPCILR
jgi:hypothetical protein